MEFPDWVQVKEKALYWSFAKNFVRVSIWSLTVSDEISSLLTPSKDH